MHHPHTFDELLAIMTRLRAECPWDREQTHDSIKGNTIEEAFEVVEAIDEKDDEGLAQELGDLLLHVVFHAEIAAGEGRFTIDTVLTAIIEKLVRRHPHIFGDTEATSADEVKKNWEQIKLSEGRESVIDGIPRALPALLKAHRIQEKASKVGFDWPSEEPVWAKVEEELAEFRVAIAEGTVEQREAEFGDLLFALVNYARFQRINAEDALRGTIDRFARRFRHIEQSAAGQGRTLAEMTLAEMDQFWEEAKEREKATRGSDRV